MHSKSDLYGKKYITWGGLDWGESGTVSLKKTHVYVEDT